MTDSILRNKSKEFAKSVKKRFPFGTVEISYTSEHGVLTDVMIRGDYFGEADTGVLENSLTGVRLCRDDLLEKLRLSDKYIFGSKPEDIAEMFEL